MNEIVNNEDVVSYCNTMEILFIALLGFSWDVDLLFVPLRV